MDIKFQKRFFTEIYFTYVVFVSGVQHNHSIFVYCERINKSS